MKTATPKTTSPSKRKMARTLGWAALPVGLLSIFGAGCIDGPLGALLSLGLLLVGVNPLEGFSDNGQVAFSLVQVAEDGEVVGTNDGADDKEPAAEEPGIDAPDEEIEGEDGEIIGTDDGTDDKEPVAEEPAAPAEVDYFVEVFEPQGVTATVDRVIVEAVEEVGTFSVIIDSSGSMENSYPADASGFSVCPTCPHDPSRQRVEATQVLVKELLARSPESRMGVFDFGAGPSGDDFKVTRVLQGYTSDSDALVKGAELTESAEGTFIYDSALEVLDLMNGDIQAHFQTKPITKAMVFISDGEDTESTANLQAVIDRALELEIPIHVIAIGTASDKFKESYQTDVDNSAIVSDFQRLANDTGGFYAAINKTEDLVQLAEVIALGLTGGYEKLVTTLEPIPSCGTVVKGRIYAGNPKENPDLQGEDWSFVAPCK